MNWGWNWVGLGWDWVWGDWGLRGWGLGLDNKMLFSAPEGTGQTHRHLVQTSSASKEDIKTVNSSQDLQPQVIIVIHYYIHFFVNYRLTVYVL